MSLNSERICSIEHCQNIVLALKKKRIKSGDSSENIAKDFNVTGQNIRCIKNNQTWRHVNV